MLKHQELKNMLLAALNQPPSGGCVLKLANLLLENGYEFQPPSGGCVLKPARLPRGERPRSQPPSGGCVLKLGINA